ncbi:MAG TPA: hypothetical protein VNG12_25865, partial [Acidimicrobiales bacterium]|nr:hypothetical protein [Acidimicrobiales bacterium]
MKASASPLVPRPPSWTEKTSIRRRRFIVGTLVTGLTLSALLIAFLPGMGLLTVLFVVLLGTDLVLLRHRKAVHEERLMAAAFRSPRPRRSTKPIAP